MGLVLPCYRKIELTSGAVPRSFSRLPLKTLPKIPRLLDKIALLEEELENARALEIGLPLLSHDLGHEPFRQNQAGTQSSETDTKAR